MRFLVVLNPLLHSSLWIEPQGKPLDKDLIQTISCSLNARPVGIQGVGRSTMALTQVMIVGMGIFHVTLHSIGLGKVSIIEDLMLTPAGAIYAIVGFYFEGRGNDTRSTTTPINSGDISGSYVAQSSKRILS